MEIVRKPELETTFKFDYVIRGFASLETSGDADPHGGRPFDTWTPDYLGPLASFRLENLEETGIDKAYKGTISISLLSLEPTPVIVGRDIVSKMQPHKSGGRGPLPTAKFEICMTFVNLDRDLLRGLHVLVEEANKDDPMTLLAEAFQNPEMLSLANNETDYRSKVIKNFLGQIEKLWKELEPLMKSLGFKTGLRGDVHNKDVARALSVVFQILERNDPTGEQRRAYTAQYLEMYKALMFHRPDSRSLPALVEAFGNDFFMLFRCCMNLIIRHLKYDHEQFWLKEITKFSGGYFFIENGVTMDGEGLLIPASRHAHTTELLDAGFLLHSAEWSRIREALSNVQSLSSRVGDFAYSAIFSEADTAFEDGHLVGAILLAHAGLEASLTQVLERLFDFNPPDISMGKKVAFIQCCFRKALPEDAVSAQYRALWRLIEGEPKPNKPRPRKYWDYQDGLIPIRNDIQHRRRIKLDDPRRLAQYISAARTMSNLIVRWSESPLSREIRKPCEGVLKPQREEA